MILKLEKVFSFVVKDFENLIDIDEKVFLVSNKIDSEYNILRNIRDYFVPIEYADAIRKVLITEKIKFTEK